MQRKCSLLSALSLILVASPTALVSASGWPGTNKALNTTQDLSSATTALNNLPAAHPYIETLGLSAVNRVRAQLSQGGASKVLFDRLVSKATWDLKQPIGTYKADAGLFLTVARDCLRRVQSCALLYKLTGDAKYLTRAKAEMLAAAAMPDWYPAHFLGTAQMTHALAYGYDWLYADLSSDDRRTISTAIRTKGLAEGLKAYGVAFGQNTSTNSFWTNNLYNWNPVCNGSMIIGALAIAKDDPTLAKNVITAARGSLRIYFAGQSNDGANTEGADYWSYGVEYIASSMSGLLTSTGQTLEFVPPEWLENTGNWRSYMGSGDLVFGFGDSYPGSPAAGAMTLSKLTGNNDLALFAYKQAQVSDPRPGDLLYGDNSILSGQSILAPSAIFPSMSMAFLKTSWDPNALSLSIKGGDNNLPHNHLDLGTFVLNWGGTQWASMLGADSYSLPHYTDSQRGTIYRVGTQGQNSMMAGGVSQDLNGKGTITWSKTSGTQPAAILDLSGGYKNVFSSWQRGATVSGNLYALLQDEWTTSKTTQVVWQMHTKASVVLAGTTARLTLGGKTMTMKILTPGAAFTRGNCQPASPQAANPGITKIEVVFSSTAWAPKKLAIVFAPGMAAPNVPVDNLSNWSRRSGI